MSDDISRLPNILIIIFDYFLGNVASSSIPSPQLKPLKNRAMGVISGVATNLKSRLSQLNSSPSHHQHQQQHHQQQQPHHQESSKARTYSPSREMIKRPSPTHGEQSPSLIPLTVPGADSTMPSFPYGEFGFLVVN